MGRVRGLVRSIIRVLIGKEIEDNEEEDMQEADFMEILEKEELSIQPKLIELYNKICWTNHKNRKYVEGNWKYTPAILKYDEKTFELKEGEFPLLVSSISKCLFYNWMLKNVMI